MSRPAPRPPLDWAVLPTLLDVPTTARLLGVHPNTLRQWDANGKLRAVRLGRRRDRRFDRERVRTLWRKQQAPSTRGRPRFSQSWQTVSRVSRPKPLIAAASVLLLLVGILQQTSRARADVGPSQPIVLLPRSCTGWVGAERAVTTDLGAAAAPADFTELNSAVYASDRNIIQADLQSGGVVSGGLDQESAAITCQGFTTGTTPAGEVGSVDMVLALRLDGQANSTDDVAIRTSFDGSTWTTVKVLPLAEPTAGQITLPLPADLDVGRLAKLQIQVTAATDPTRWVSRVWLDGVAIKVAAKNRPKTINATVPSSNTDLGRLVAFSRGTYQAGEQPVVTVPRIQTKKFLFITTVQTKWELKKLELIDHAGVALTPRWHGQDIRRGSDTETNVTLDTAQLHPGKYRLRLTMTSSDGMTAASTKEFFWGVVALNVTRAIARPGDSQTVGIAVLDDNGKTICDAAIALTVTDPKGQATTYSTKDGTVQLSRVCVDKGVTNTPDYFVTLKPDIPGVYQLHLEASTRAGQRSYDDTFQVDRGVTFEIERYDFPTRIYPPAAYPVRLAITPSRDYRGTIREELPASFAVTSPFPEGRLYRSTTDASVQYVEWDVDWKQQETYYLGYTFDAPDVSPALFRLGPLRIGGNFIDPPVFQEPRQWQLASDAVNIRVQGTLYSNEGTTAIDCSAANKTVKLEVNNTASYSATCSLASGAYDFGTTISVNASDVLTIYISGATEKGSRTTRVAATPADITGADVYQNRAIVSHEDSGPITNTNLDNWDSGNDADVPYTVTSGALTVAASRKLIVWTGKTFTPGGTVTTTAASDQANPDGDVLIQASATLSMGTNALSIGGDYTNSGTFSKSTGQTTTLTGTVTGFGITMGTGNFDSLTFNGSGGDWTPTAAVTVDVTLTMTAGTLKGTQNVTVTGAAVGTAGVITLTGGTFEQRVSAGKNFGPTTASTNWTFSTLTFSNSNAGATPITITTQSCSTCGVTVTSVLNVGKTGDATGATTTLSAGDKTWTLSGTGTPLVMLASPAAVFTPSTSTVAYTGTSATTMTPLQYYGLTTGVNDANSVTYTISAAAPSNNCTTGTWSSTNIQVCGGALTIATGDTLSTNQTLNVAGSSTFTLNGTLTGTGTLNYYSSTEFPTGGTVSIGTCNWNAYFNDLIMSPRTYGCDSRMLNTSASNRVIYMGAISESGSITVSGTGTKRIVLFVPTTGKTFTLDNTRNNYDVSISGGTSNDLLIGAASGQSGTPILQAGNGTWTVAGAVTFTNGTLTAGNSTIKMNGTSKSLTSASQTLYNFEVSGGTVSMADSPTISNNLTVSGGTLTGPSSGTITVGGMFSNSSTFTHNSSTVILNGASGGIAGSSNTTFNSLTISGTITVTASNPTVATLLTVDVSKSLTINSGLTVTLSRNNASDSLTLNGTINGPGRLTYQNATANSFTTAGTLAAALIVRFDTVNGNLTIPARADYGAIEAYGGSANARTVTLGTGASQTITTSSYFYVIADAVSPNNVTVSATTNNPTVNVGGDLDFTGTGTASEIIQSGTGTWTVSGSADFTNGTYTATSGTTLAMNGTSKTLTSASQSLYNFTVSGGSVTVGDATTITNDLSVTGGTMSGTSNITVNGNAAGTAGIINLTGGTFEQRVAAGKNFGPTTASTSWTFSTLTFSNSNAGATPITISAQSCSTCGVTVSSVLNVGKTGDAAGATTTLDASDKTWTLSGSGTPLVLLASPAAVFTASTSTVSYTSASATNITNVTYNILTLAPSAAGGPVYTLPSGTLTINNNLTVGDGTNAVTVSNTTNNTVVNVSADLTVNASATFSGSGTGTFTINGHVTGAGTVTLTGNTFEQRVAAAKNFGSSGGSNAWTFNNLTFSNSHASSAYTITYQSGGTGDTSVTGTLTVSKVADTAATALSLASGRTLTSGTAGTVTINTSGTVSGAGTLVVQNSNLGTGGTLSSVVRFDATSGNVTAPARTYGGNVEAYSNSAAAARSVILGSGTQTLQGTLTVTANNSQNLTLDGATNDPTLNLTGNLSMSKPSSGTPIITAPDTGSVTWTMSGSVDFSNGTYTKGTETLTMNGTGTLTTNGNTLNNFTTSGSGTITLANATHTLAGNLNIGSTGLTAGSSTVALSGSSKTIDGGGKTLNNLTISDSTTLQNTDLTVAATLAVANAKTLTLNSSRALTLSGNSGTTLDLNSTGIVTGGTIVYQNSATTVTTSGTISSAFTFDLVNGNETIPNRTFGGAVVGYNNTTSARSLIFGTAVTPTFTGGLDLQQANATGTLLLDGATNNPTTVTMTGNFTTSVATGSVTVSMGSGTWNASANFSLANVTTFNNNSGKLAMVGTGTLTSNGKTLNNLDINSSGTVTLAAATHILAGNLLLAGSGTPTVTGSTIVMSGTTKTIDGGGKTLNNLTISGTETLQNTDLTVSGTLQIDVSQQLTINVSRTLTHSGATLTLNGTIAGAGMYAYQSATTFPTSGTISSLLRFDATNNNQTAPARTYGGYVEFYSNSTTAMRTVTLGSGTFTFSSHFYVTAANTQDVTVSGETNSPTVNITGNLDFIGAGTGTEVLASGNGTWTVSGNVDLSDGFYSPKVADVNPTWDNAGYYEEVWADNGIGGCYLESSQNTCDTASSTSLNAGVNNTSGHGSVCIPTKTDRAYRTYLKYDLSSIANTNTVIRAAQEVNVTSAGDAVSINRAGSDTPDAAACSALYGVGGGTAYNSWSSWTTGHQSVEFLVTGVSDLQPKLGSAAYALIISGGSTTSSVLTSTDSSTNKPVLRIGYVAQSTTPTLVMNGTGTLTTGLAGFYNLTLSGTVTVNAASSVYVYNTLDMTGGTVTNNNFNLVMAGTSTTLTGGGNTIGNLRVEGSTTSTLTGSDLTLSNQLFVVSGGTLSLGSGRNLNFTGSSFTLAGTISGSGTLVYQTSTTFPTGGTVSSLLRFDATNGNETMSARTYGGAVELYNNSASTRTVSTAGAGTYALSSTLTLTKAGAGGLTFDMNTTDPTTFTVSGALSVGTGTTLSATSSGTFNINSDYTNNGTFTHNSGTVTMAGNTANITGSASTTFSGLTISGTTITVPAGGSDITVAGVLTINAGKTLSIGSGRTVTDSGSADLSWGDGSSTISGAGTLTFNNATSGGPGTSGVISTPVRYDATSNDIPAGVVDARTYGGQVEIYNNSSTASRTVTMASGTYTFSSHFYLTAANTQDVTVSGETNSPTVNITGNLDFTGTGAGTEVIAAGNGTWTVSGSVDLTSGFYAPKVVNLSPSWDQTSIDSVFNTENPPGSCQATLTFSCESDTATTLSAGLIDNSLGSDCTYTGDYTNYFYRHGMRYSLASIPSTATITAARLGVTVASTTTQTITVGRATKDDPTVDACTTAARFNDLNPTAYDNIATWNTTGRKDVNLKATAVTDIQSRISGSQLLALAIKGDETTNAVGSINSSENATLPPVLRVGYAATGTTPTLVMNGTSTLTADLNGFYNLTLSGAVTLGDAGGSGFYLYGTLDMTGSTITPGSATAVVNGTSVTLKGGSQTLAGLTMGTNSNTTLTGSDLTVSSAMDIGTSSTLTIGSGRNLTFSGSTLTLNGTITGTGTLVYQRTTVFPTTGTLTSGLRFDATNGNEIMSARTYGGAVELYNNSASARTISLSVVGGTYMLSSTLTLTKAGAGGLTFDMNTNDPTTFTVSGALSVGTGTTLSATSSGTFNANGDYTNNGTFTDNSGTVTLAGSAQQTLSGTMTGSSDFNNLTITNSSGSDPDSSPSVIFGAAATTAGTFTAATAGVKLRFNAGSTYAPTAINFNGQATGTRVFLRSSTPGTQWTINAGAGSRTVTYTSVKDSNACGSTGGSIDASDGTNVSESGNDCWTIATLRVTLSANSVALGSLSPATVTKGSITSTITSSAPNGYSSLVKYDQTLASGSNTIADTGGSITQGTAGYGLSTSKAGQTIAQTTGACTSGTGTFNASSLSTTFQSFASASGTASSDVTTLCFLATPSVLTPPGAYTSTTTIVTTAKF